jgi:hypothetical protein
MSRFSRSIEHVVVSCWPQHYRYFLGVFPIGCMHGELGRILQPQAYEISSAYIINPHALTPPAVGKLITQDGLKNCSRISSKAYPCSAELISTAYQPWNSVFLSQQISYSRLISQKNSLPNRPIVFFFLNN